MKIFGACQTEASSREASLVFILLTLGSFISHQRDMDVTHHGSVLVSKPRTALISQNSNLSVVDYGSLVQLQRPLGKPGGAKVKYSCYISRDNKADIPPCSSRGPRSRSSIDFRF